jgi:competence protein ComFB
VQLIAKEGIAMPVKNCMEAFVYEAIENMLDSYPGICTCEQCQKDIAAYALNHLPPKYIRTNIGDIYTRLDLYDKSQYTQIMRAVAQAIEVVSKNPHHQPGININK